jgi:transcriptional regulator with XRE-family HTH domain
MATQALINPELLSWARQRSGLSEGELANKLSVALDKFISWELGKEKPTFKQAQNIAKHTHVPFGFLFLPAPPKEYLPIPDLRTIEGTGIILSSMKSNLIGLLAA